jgi:hypothetical protein
MIFTGLRSEKFSDRTVKADQTGRDIEERVAGRRESLNEVVNNLW